VFQDAYSMSRCAHESVSPSSLYLMYGSALPFDRLSCDQRLRPEATRRRRLLVVHRQRPRPLYGVFGHLLILSFDGSVTRGRTGDGVVYSCSILGPVTGWVTGCWQLNHLGMYPTTWVNSAFHPMGTCRTLQVQ